MSARGLTILAWILAAVYVLSIPLLPPQSLDVLPMFVVIFQPDSDGYTDFSSARSLGYPLLLQATHALTGAYENIRWVQTLAYALACLLLWHTLQKECSRPHRTALMFICWLVILFNPICYAYHAFVLTDSLFYSAVITITALTLRVWQSDFRDRTLALALCIGLITTVRPAGLAFLPFLPLLWWLKPRQARTGTLKPCLVAVAVMLAIFGLERGAHHVYHDGNTHSILPKHLLAKAVTMSLEADEPAYLSAAASHAIYTRFTPFASMDAPVIHRCLTQWQANQEVFIQGTFAPPPDMSAIAFARHVYSHEPGRVLANVLCHYIGGWSVLDDRSLFWAPRYEALLQDGLRHAQGGQGYPQVRAMLLEEAQKLPTPNIPATLLSAGFMLACAVVLMMTLRGGLWFLRKGTIPHTTLWPRAVMLSFMVNGYFLFIAIFNVANPRYSLAVAAPILVCLAHGSIVLWERILNRKPSAIP